MTTSRRPSKAAVAAIAAAALSSVATSAPEEPSWSFTEERDLGACEVDAEGFANYLVEAGTEFPADSGLWSITLSANAKAESDDADPTVTVEVRDAESDVVYVAETRRGEEGSAHIRVDHSVLEWEEGCAIPESGRGSCEQVFIVRVRVEPEAELSFGRILYTASGDKETHDEPDPDVAVALSARCAEAA